MLKNKKAFSPQAIVVLIILIVLVMLIFSSGITKEADPSKEGSAANKFAKFLGIFSLFAQTGSQGQLYAKGNTEKLLQLPKDVTLDPLYDYPFDRSFSTCVTSDFGPRNYPPENFHYGIDLRCKDFSPTDNPNRPIKSISGGKVVLTKLVRTPETPAGYNAGPFPDELGSQVHVYDKDKGYVIIYGHLDQISVTQDQNINPGDEIGKCGTTGASTAEHLHLQIHAIKQGEDLRANSYFFTKEVPKKGGPVNPVRLIYDRLQCCRNLAGGDDACNPGIVDREEFEARLNQ